MGTCASASTPSTCQNKMLSCAGADRLSSGMRHAFGKALGVCARVKIGQIIYSCRSSMKNRAHLIEALRRASYKFAGRQHIVVSNKWGFTPFTHAEYKELRSKVGLYDQGDHVTLKNGHGPILEAGVKNAFVRYDA